MAHKQSKWIHFDRAYDTNSRTYNTDGASWPLYDTNDRGCDIIVSYEHVNHDHDTARAPKKKGSLRFSRKTSGIVRRCGNVSCRGPNSFTFDRNDGDVSCHGLSIFTFDRKGGMLNVMYPVHSLLIEEMGMLVVMDPTQYMLHSRRACPRNYALTHSFLQLQYNTAELHPRARPRNIRTVHAAVVTTRALDYFLVSNYAKHEYSCS